MSPAPMEWLTKDSEVAGPCMTCGRSVGLVLVRDEVRLCFTCAMDAGKAAAVATGFVRPARGGEKDR